MCHCGHAENVHILQVCGVIGCRCIHYEPRHPQPGSNQTASGETRGGHLVRMLKM